MKSHIDILNHEKASGRMPGIYLLIGCFVLLFLLQACADSGDMATAPEDSSDPGIPYGTPSPDVPEDKSSVDFASVEVFYGTDRQATGSKEPADWYGFEAGKINYGTCLVSIPRDHRMGELESPSIFKLEFREDPEKHVVLLNVSPKDKDTYFEALSDRVIESDKCEAFVFVHGYNVSFKEAARRTAQMSYDLAFPGAPAFFSWPSRASLAGYGADEKTIASSKNSIKTFLKEFLAFSGAEEIYLIGHSMGTRGLTGALIDLMAEVPDARGRISEVILAAPDINADNFKNMIAPKIVLSARAVTLYASSNDKALLASRALHGIGRAGDTEGGLPIIVGMESIDASSVETSLLGHSYYAETQSILSDMFYLLKEGKRANERFGLEPVRSERGTYWRFRR